MNRFNKSLAAIFTAPALLLASAAQAMEIRQFDKMADQDQADYTVALINGAEKILTDEGRPDLAAQVEHLFTTKYSGDADTIGMGELIRNVAILRVADAENRQKNPNDPGIEVEDAMAVTLENNHIKLPDSFYTVASNFHPQFPPKKL